MKKEPIVARKPRGFADRRADELLYAGELAEKIGTVYKLYGFEPMETPFIEYTDALGKFLPDKDRPNEGVFSFLDDDEWLSLRYDLTAPLARFFAENMADLPIPFRSFRNGWVFRNEKAKPGRFRQFLQFDADTVGTDSPAADAELCMMGADTLEYLGIKRGDFVIRVNNRKIMDGILENIGLTSEADQERKLTVMRAMDKLDKVGFDGVEELLGKGRLDESGDFTPGAELAPDAQQIVLSFLKIEGKNANDVLNSLEKLVGSSKRGQEGVAELRYMQSLFDAAGYGSDRIKIDPSVVRGLEYYTGPVFEAELCVALVNKDGIKTAIGSIGGGGRYDGLVSRFFDDPVPATGFSIGLSRLMAGLKHLGKLYDKTDGGPVVVLALDKDKEAFAGYQKMVDDLRKAGIKAELYLGNAGLKGQLKYADKRNSPCVVIQGSDERAAGVVQVKDLIEGARLSKEIENNEEWRQNNPAQKTIKESELVNAVQEILKKR